MNRLKTNFLGTEFKNPLIGASGTYGYGEEYKDYYPVDLIGGISSKGVTYYKKDGNEGIRIQETPSGLLNSIGLENPGIHAFVKDILPKMMTLGPKIFVNLGSNTMDEYVKSAEILNEYDFDFLELNISCPNVKEGGMAFGIKCESAEKITRKIKEVSRHKVVVKLSPNAENIVENALAVESGGADGISLVNTFLGMAIDFDKRKPVFNNIYAGLSGPAIKPIALRMVHQVAHAVKIPVIGIGGITSARDALEFIMAGAKLVQIGTYNFMNPYGVKKILEDMKEYLEKENTNVEELYKII